jgi:hypothetical protein
MFLYEWIVGPLAEVETKKEICLKFFLGLRGGWRGSWAEEWDGIITWGLKRREGRGKIVSVCDSIARRKPRLENGAVRERHGVALGGDPELALGSPPEGRQSCPLAGVTIGSVGNAMAWYGLMSCFLDASSCRPALFQKEDAEKSSQIKNEDTKGDGLSEYQKAKETYMHCIWGGGGGKELVWEMSDIANV